MTAQPEQPKFDGIEDLPSECSIDVRAVRCYYRIRNMAPASARQAWETRMAIRDLVGRSRLAKAQQMLDEMLEWERLA